MNSFKSEWLKTRRSLASWLVVLGAFFIPCILFFVRVQYPDKLKQDAVATEFWQTIFSHNWQTMSLMLLPLGVILATSLIAQLEYRNNTWKQVHTTPQHLHRIFFTKLAVIITMLLQFFLLFNLGIYLSGVLPHLIHRVELPQQHFPWSYFFYKNGLFIVDCLPILALQYLISLQAKNFLVPLCAGIGLQVASLIAVEWEYGYLIPYTYCPYNFFDLRKAEEMAHRSANIHYWALGYFVLFIALGYVLYLTKKEKG